MPIDDYAKMISTLVDADVRDMFSMLETMVNMDSGSADVDDVNALGDYLVDRLAALGATIQRFPQKNAGFPLAGTFLPPDAGPETRRILLVGHRDTVFPSGTAATRPFSQNGQNSYGPGVSDMKGGIVAGYFALKTLLALQDKTGPLPLEALFTSDEEIGSAASGPVIVERCRTAKAAFFLEPARPNGALVIGRDGGDLFRIDVRGKAAHAGNNFPDGISAVNALASVVTAFAALSDDPGGMNVNVGIIGGGSGAIIVPDHAWALVSTRFSTIEQRAFLLDHIRTIVRDNNGNGISIAMSDPVGFLPFRENEDNKAMFALVREAGGVFDLDLAGVTTGSGADAGLASSNGVPTICGMGPIGGNLHTDKEFMVSASLPERTKVLALSILLASRRFS